MSKSRPRNRQGSARAKNLSTNSVRSENWLWGTHAVLAALANPERRCERLVASQNARRRGGAALSAAEDLAPGAIDALLPPGAVHQGVAGQFTPLPETALEELIAAETPRLVVLDQLSDPHNLGAVYRSAAAFGFSGIIHQTRHAAALTGVVAKAAVGAVERVATCRVVNIARSLESLAEAGYHTVGLAGSGRNTVARAVAGADKLALVLGAEGPGLRPGVAKACAELARIPIAAEMESLNVSNAAAIAFYEASRSA